MKQKIAIVGTGKMGKALAHGFLNKKIIKPSQLILTKPDLSDLSEFAKNGVQVTTDNKIAVQKADIVIFAVKPQVMSEVLREVQPVIKNTQLIISIAAGTTIRKITKFIGKGGVIVRVMPNLCTQIGESVSGWTTNKKLTKAQQKLVIEILEAVGTQVYISKENLINAVTAISGSGPAYFFYLANALEEAGVSLGLPKKIAANLANQTLIGSGLLLKSTNKTTKDLISSVASKGGTTEAALKIFNEQNLTQKFLYGVKAAAERAETLNSFNNSN
ncbi:MAG TPA: pyrroline-5-carboxylate reductase [Patescibacteria group bacterium]|nr:pyrroline-5-carboxylate reductase [Patescibacteria group bacterium]